jgi:hypothetical protein
MVLISGFSPLRNALILIRLFSYNCAGDHCKLFLNITVWVMNTAQVSQEVKTQFWIIFQE